MLFFFTPAEAAEVRERDPREWKAARGDRKALAGLFDTHAASIASVCRHIAGANDAADATQQAFERIVRNVEQFNPDAGTFRAWAFMVARNCCRDRLRRRGFEARTFEPDDEPQLDTKTSSPEEVVAIRVDAIRLEKALETLPEPTRTAIVLFHLHDASYEEISQTLDVPLGTVMTWMHRGRAKLRTLLENS